MNDPAGPFDYRLLSRGQWNAAAAPADIQTAIDQFYEWLNQLSEAGKMKPGQPLRTAASPFRIKAA